jgi:hypothetical protein
MTTDLREALRSLHDDARRDAADLPTRPLVARARRRRTLVRTGYGAAGLGTAAAVAVGGVALSGRLGRTTPPPPAVTTTAPAPSPSATHAAEPSPTPSWTPTAAAPFQPDLAACGTTFDPYDGDINVYTEETWQVDPGATARLDYRVELEAAPGERISVAPVTSVLVAAPPEGRTGDPVVVGVAGAPLPGLAARVLEPSVGEGEGGDGAGWASLALPLDVPYVMCPGTTGAGGPPPAGQYEAWTRVQLVKDGTTHASWGSAYGAVGPWPHGPRQYAPEGTVQIDSSADQSACGQESFYSADDPYSWSPSTGDLTATASARLDGGKVVVALRLANSGSALQGAEIRYPTYYVVNDVRISSLGQSIKEGSIIRGGNVGEAASPSNGWTGGPTPTWTPARNLAKGGAVQLETNVGDFTCTFALGERWPSATYTVYAFTEVGMPDGTSTTVFAPAVTLTVP